MPGKELRFENGTVVDACDHTPVDLDGLSVCKKCGDILEDDE